MLHGGRRNKNFLSECPVYIIIHAFHVTHDLPHEKIAQFEFSAYYVTAFTVLHTWLHASVFLIRRMKD